MEFVEGKSERMGLDDENIKQDPFTSCLLRVQMDTKPRIQDFRDAMLLDPHEKNSLEDMKKEIENLSFETDVYPEEVMQPLIEAIDPYEDSFKHPRCMFVFDSKMVRKIVESWIKNHKKTDEEKLLAFGLLDMPNKYI